ncbi:MAG: hypothetical protein HYZ53_25930, partial [Planctomycetes bacterium]|nr:hypothetical protein [Planctomycetota bacterium]
MLRSRFVAPLVVVAALFAAGLAFLYSVLAPAPGGDRGAAVAGASARGAVRPRSSPAPGTTAKPAKPPTPSAGPALPSKPTVTLPPGSAPKIAPSLVRDGESAKAEGPDFEAVFARGGMLFSRKPSG